MNLSLGSRVPNALPYLLLALGLGFFSLPFVLSLEPSNTFNFLNAGHPYVVAGVFALLYTKRKVEKTLYVLAVPAVTFLVLTGTWLYFESPSPYELSIDGILVLGAVSFFFVLGYTAKKRDWAYVAASVIAYSVCVLIVVSSSVRLDLLRLDLQNPLLLAVRLLYIIGSGIPLAVVAYFVLGGDPSKRKRAYLAASLLAYVVWIEVLTGSVGLTLRSLASTVATVLGLGVPLAVVVYFPLDGGSDKKRRSYIGASLLAYVVWIVVLPVSVVLNLLSLIFVLPLIVGLWIPQVVVPYLLSDDDSKRREWAYLGASLLAYVVWICIFDIVIPSLFTSWEGYFVLALTVGAGTPLAVVAYFLSTETNQVHIEGGKQV